MAADIVDLADAIATSIDGATFTAPYVSPSVERAWVPVNDVRALEELKITVVGRGINGEVASRRRNRANAHLVEVALQKQVSPDDRSAIDALLLLAQEIADHLMQTELTVGGRKVAPTAVDHDPLYDPEMLNQAQEFLCVMTFTYGWVR